MPGLCLVKPFSSICDVLRDRMRRVLSRQPVETIIVGMGDCYHTRKPPKLAPVVIHTTNITWERAKIFVLIIKTRKLKWGTVKVSLKHLGSSSFIIGGDTIENKLFHFRIHHPVFWYLLDWKSILLVFGTSTAAHTARQEANEGE